jgi:hypothetical protein
MTHRICVTKAPTLKDLLDQVAAAVDGLGKDALWTGYEDGRIYMWRKDKDVDRGIEPNTKYRCETGLTKVIE